MQKHTLEVVADPSLSHSFVLVSKKYLETNIRPLCLGNAPPVVPLRIVASSGTIFVGCLVQATHQIPGHKIVFPQTLAMSLNVSDGEIVQCFPTMRLPQATKVMVSPLSADESEVVEKNAVQIEMQLLQQLQVVSPGMPITVFLRSGMTAKLKVYEIECGEGNAITTGGAVMTEGTLFIVAVRQRESRDHKQEEKNPSWGILRAVPSTDEANKDMDTSARKVYLEVSLHSAEQWNWKDGMEVEIIDLSSLTQQKEKTISATLLRSIAHKSVIKISKEVSEGSCCFRTCQMPTNVLVIPAASVSVGSTEMEKTDGPAKEPQAKLPSWDELCMVHGDVPADLLHHLKFSFMNPKSTTNGNALVAGGKGYGKSTLVSCVLRELKGIHVVKLNCFVGKDFINELSQALLEAILCAPSVLVLDDFDMVAPEEKEGNNPAMSDPTKALLYGILKNYSSLLGLVERTRVLVVATCASRDTVNQRFRDASVFPTSWSINPLTRSTREILLKQCLPSATSEEAKKIAGFLENYSPFDIYRLSLRVLNTTTRDESLIDRAQRIASAFTPLSHTGISFLKGTKVNFGEIGGLKEAKKVLYDTLVLPIQHPKLFSKLPLKTRSGILLYGPSGCGKTFILESLVKAENLNCLVVNGPEVFGKYIGQSEQKIRDVFERAQAAAPCVVFFDEFDSVAPQRGLDNSGVTDRVVNQLLCYLDGVEGRKDVFVVAASSRPDLIDAALLRPGRLDKAVACPIPSLDDRREILHHLLSKTQSVLTEEDINHIAGSTQNWTPADLSALVSTANTMACQDVLASLPSGSGGVESSVEDRYHIADTGSHSIDKIKDSLKFLSKSTKIQEQTVARIEITLPYIMSALEKTNPSLSQADIKKFERIHALFSKHETIVPAKPGTKLTSS